MPRSNHGAARIRRLASDLLDRLEADEPGITAKLRFEMVATLVARDDIGLVFSDELIDSECSIAAAYLRNSYPPRIVVGSSLSRGRLLFSLAHEFCHHLIDTSIELADVLYEEPDGGRRLEEDICDSFAAMILISERDTDLAIQETGMCARAVVRLYERTSASREASAVAVAQRLSTEGYVVLIRDESSGELEEQALAAQFTARAGGALPVARMTVQDDALLLQGARSGRARGYARLRFPSGAYSDEYHADVVRSGMYLFAVLVADAPPWGGVSVRSSRGGGYALAWCEHCVGEFQPISAACSGCGDHVCPDCRRCGCAAAPAPRARICSECFQEAPGQKFVGDRCAICAGVE